MKNVISVFVVMLAFSATAMAFDIAISTQANWWSQGAADREMQEIVDNVTAVAVELFPVDQQDALAEWVEAHTGDGLSDLLILCGQFPDTIYEPGNGQADDSLAELFLDDGNCIINTGDYMFYVVNGGGTNAAGGLQTMMDIPGITMWDDNTAVVVTDDGREFTPTLEDYQTDRPFHLDELQDPWEAELILASNDAVTRADPVIVHNIETDGRLGIFYQTASQDDDPRGEVISEWINNWYLPNVGGRGGNPLARRPDPKDGALHEDTWITLSWQPGFYAVSHDVFLGENFDDVNDATRDSDVFRGNQGETFYIAGFPGFAYPEGLVPGTTYYWRIDEVNDANTASPWKGDVWSFSIPPKTAYNPVPADGAKFIDGADLTLSWTPGFGAKLHTVYFGDDFDTVANAAGGMPTALTTYKPGPLEIGKTYYWRVDEFDAVETHKGNVWTFTTAKEGGGLRAEYYHWSGDFPPPNAFQSFVVSEIVPEIDWNWGDGSPHPSVNVDDFGCKFIGEVEAAFTETYKFHVTTDDGQRLWVDGKRIIDRWVQQGMTEWSGEIDLVAGQKYSIELHMYEHGGGAGCEMRWSSPSTPKQIVPQAALSLPVKARNPNPPNGGTGASLTPILTWQPGEQAASHEVYFGEDADAVANATKASPEFKATKALGDESFDPGKLAWNTTYYWRVDEVNNTNADSPWLGNVWSFTTGDFLLVDDFESYTNNDADGEAIWQHWIDGFGVADNGAQVGYLLPPYAEQSIVHGGAQSMPLLYTNELGVTNSEAVLTLTRVKDWTEENVAELSLWYYGDAANAPERMYVMVSNAVVPNDDAAAAQVDDWTQMVVPLQAFADQGVTLTNVTNIGIGLGSKGGASAGGSGTMFIDDIRLYREGEAAGQ